MCSINICIIKEYSSPTRDPDGKFLFSNFSMKCMEKLVLSSRQQVIKMASFLILKCDLGWDVERVPTCSAVLLI